MVLPKASVDKWMDQLHKNRTPVITLKNPASFTNRQGVAAKFAINRGGKRDVGGGTPVILRTLIPKGTRLARVYAQLDIGLEHIVASGSRVSVTDMYTAKMGRKKVYVVEGVLGGP